MNSDNYDSDTAEWCDTHANTRTECECRPPGDAGLLTSIKSGRWLDAQRFPALRYAIRPLVPQGYTVFVGAPKTGKSWLILDSCLALAGASLALGSVSVDEPAKVLYLALEDGDARLQDRIRKLRPGQPIPERFHYATEVEHGQVINTVKAWLSAHPDTALVCLDTLGKVLPPAARGETTYERDYRIGSTLKRITDANPGLALVVVHHDRKAKSGDFVDSVSGTNGVAGSADTIIALQRDRLSTAGLLAVTGRDVQEAEFALEMHDGTTWRLCGDSLEAARASAGSVRQDMRAQRLGPDMQQVVTFVNGRGAGVRASHVADHLGIDRAKAAVYLNRAAEAGLIDRLQRGLYGPRVISTSLENVYEVLSLKGPTLNTNNITSEASA